MAELIPVHYRLRTAQKQQLEKWMLVGVVALGAALASLTYAFMWQRQKGADNSALAAQFTQKSAAIAEAQKLLVSRQDLANRMTRVQQLIDDKVLLSLLRNISEGFAATDSLEYISIDARGKKTDHASDKDQPPAEDHYMVRITGITANSATLSDLVTRLNKQASPAMNVVLESSHRENLFDGQVMRFEISCEQPGTKGT